MKQTTQTVTKEELVKNLAAGTVAGGMLGASYGIASGRYLLGIPVGILFGLLLGFRLGQFNPKMQYPKYTFRRLLLAGTFFILIAMGYLTLLDQGWTGMRAIVAGLVATAAWGALVVVIAQAIGSLDELQRRIQTEAIAIGFAGTAIVALGYGLLGLAGVVQLNWGLAILVMLPMWLVGKLWTMWRYR